MVGAVSAADTTDNSTIETSSDSIDFTDVATSTAQTNDNSVNYVKSTINVGVHLEDNDTSINPTITVNNKKEKVNSTKTYDKNLNFYYVDTTHDIEDSELNVTVSAPGYKTESQIFNTDTTKSLKFDLSQTDSYKLGRQMSIIADSKLNFSKADDVLVITTAGTPKYNGSTSEDIMEAITNYADGTVSWGKGNILMLRQTAVDPIDTCFVAKKGKDLTAVVFRNASTNIAYLGTISENMTKEEWNAYYRAVGNDDAFSFASLTNGWADNVSYLVLQEAAFHGHICEGTLGGYTIAQALMQYYPPKKETGVTVGVVGDITSYKVLGVPGDSASDAVLFFLDATAGKSGYVGFNTTSTGANSTMIGFIRWADFGKTVYNEETNAYEIENPGSGTIIIMDYDSKTNKELFKKETGITASGSLEELKYNTWWINRINNNPASLVKIILEKENLTEEQFYYLVGLTSDIKYPTTVENATNAGQTRIAAVKAHGLDYEYISNLDLPKAERSNVTASQGTLTYNDFKKIGVDASKIAKKYFDEELGVKIEKDMPNFEVLTTAGYVFMDQQSTEAVWDGLYQELGVRLTRETLLPNHRPMWKPLWFTFVLKQDDGKLMALYVRYNKDDGTFFVGELNGSHINNIGIETLNNSQMSSALQKSAFPDGNWFNIQSLTNAWANELQYDQFLTFLFHGHACPGVQPGFFMSEYILENYPLGENESYFYIASSIYCKDDSIEYLLGISPGLGNYMDQKLTSSDVESDYVNGATEEGILVVWDNELNIGRAIIMNFKWATIDTSAYGTSEAKRATQINSYVSLYKGEPDANLIEGNTILGSEEKYITLEQFNKLKSGVSEDMNTIEFIQGLPTITKEEAIALSNNGNENTNTDSNSTDSNSTNTNTNTNSNTNPTNTNKNTNTNSHNPTSTKTNSNTNSNTKSKAISTGSVSAGTSQSTLQTIGTVAAAENTESEPNTEENTPEETSEESPSSDSGKAYEISETGESNDNSNVGYAIAGICIVGAVAGYGILRSRKRE